MINNNLESNFISAVVYVRNNEVNIIDFIEKINEYLKGLFSKYEIICVDDASEDNSILQIKKLELNKSFNMVTIVEMSYFQGLEASMSAGVDIAIGDFIYEFDNCLIDYDLSLIGDVYNKSLSGFDVVSAVCDNGSWISKLFYKIINCSKKIQNNISSDRFRIVSRRCINRIRMMSTQIAFRKAMYANSGLQISEVSYKSNSNKKIKNKSVDYNTNLAIDSLILFTDIGYKAAVALSFIMMLFISFEIVYLLLDYFNGVTIEGYTTIMVVMSICFFVLFALLAVIIKYLSIILNISFTKNKYMIKNINKLNCNKGEQK